MTRKQVYFPEGLLDKLKEGKKEGHTKVEKVNVSPVVTAIPVVKKQENLTGEENLTKSVEKTSKSINKIKFVEGKEQDDYILYGINKGVSESFAQGLLHDGNTRRDDIGELGYSMKTDEKGRLLKNRIEYSDCGEWVRDFYYANMKQNKSNNFYNSKDWAKFDRYYNNGGATGINVFMIESYRKLGLKPLENNEITLDNLRAGMIITRLNPKVGGSGENRLWNQFKNGETRGASKFEEMANHVVLILPDPHRKGKLVVSQMSDEKNDHVVEPLESYLKRINTKNGTTYRAGDPFIHATVAKVEEMKNNPEKYKAYILASLRNNQKEVLVTKKEDVNVKEEKEVAKKDQEGKKGEKIKENSKQVAQAKNDKNANEVNVEKVQEGKKGEEVKENTRQVVQAKNDKNANEVNVEKVQEGKKGEEIKENSKQVAQAKNDKNTNEVNVEKVQEGKKGEEIKENAKQVAQSKNDKNANEINVENNNNKEVLVQKEKKIEEDFTPEEYAKIMAQVSYLKEKINSSQQKIEMLEKEIEVLEKKEDKKSVNPLEEYGYLKTLNSKKENLPETQETTLRP